MSLEGVQDIRAVVWALDGVLNRAKPAAWVPQVARELGLDAAAMERAVFQRDPAALLEGREDVLDRLQDWLDAQGADADAEDVLELWLPADHDPDPELSRLVQALTEAGVVQALWVQAESRRARWIAQESGWAEQVDAVLTSSAIGAVMPAALAPIEALLALPPHQILLIDSHPARVEAAEKRGWLGWDYTPGGARPLALALMPLLV